MARRTWTAAELDGMEPAEVDARFQESIVRDLAEVPPAFLARIRAGLDEHDAAAETSPRP